MKLREFCVVCNSLSRFIGTLLMCAGMVAGLLGCAADAGPPDAAALRRQFPEQADAVLRGRSAFVSIDYGFEPAMHEELRASFPARGGGPAHFELPDGFEVRVREVGAWGRGEVGEDALIYERLGGSSFWAATETGYEEWLLLDAGAVRRDAPVAMWEVEGAELRQHGETILVEDETGEARIQVTAPVAYAEGGRPVKTRLSARGATIELWVEAEGEAVLVDPGWILLKRPMGSARTGHTMTTLQSGLVLVVGGMRHNPEAPAAREHLSSTELFDPATRTFMWGPPMSGPRSGHTATLLNDGRVLVVGGTSAWGVSLQSAELYDPKTGLWEVTWMSEARTGHTATLLKNGHVFIVGGRDGNKDTKSPEIFDPEAKTWYMGPYKGGPGDSHHTATLMSDGRVLVAGPGTSLYNPLTNAWDKEPPPPSMPKDRWGHTATLLPNGRVLFAGGRAFYGGLALSSVDMLVDVKNNTWEAAPPMTTPRDGHTATLLPDGRIVFAGGCTDAACAYFTAELYDRKTSSVPAGMLIGARVGAAAALLPDGRVLIAGGVGHPMPLNTLADAVLFDPASPGFFSAPSPNHAHYSGHQATLLDDGRVLVTGDGPFPKSAEVFEPETHRWTDVQPMINERKNHSAIKLEDGRVFVFGGYNGEGPLRAEIFDPQAIPPGWTEASPSSIYASGATLMKNGRVLVTGVGADGIADKAVLFDPVTMKWTVAPPMTAPRGGHAMIRLSDGRVLVTGGSNEEFDDDPVPLASAEIFNPKAMTWKPLLPMALPRHGHTATELLDGRVLILGGGESGLPPELFDPVALTWTHLPLPPKGPDGFTATRLLDGRVLIVGGGMGDTQKTGELFDPQSQGFTLHFQLAWPRRYHSATLLKNGQVLIVAGVNNSTAELFDLQGTGTACLASRDCKSGFCVDGVCCERSCGASACEACSEYRGATADGVCTPLHPECAPYACVPPGGECATSCESARDCAPGHACNLEGDCVPLLTAQSYVDNTSCSFKPSARAAKGSPRGAKLGLLFLAALATRRRRRVHSPSR